MPFDYDAPASGSQLASEPVRSNFQALAQHHRATQAPAGPREGYIWWDASNAQNEKLKCYIGQGWLTLFEHMESAPIPVRGGATTFAALTDTPASYTGQGGKIVSVKGDLSGLEFTAPAGGGSFTRGVLTGSFDQKAQYVYDHVNISGFPNDAIVTGLMVWPSPIGGGQYTAEKSYSMALMVLPSDAAASSDGSNLARRRTTNNLLGARSAPLTANAAQGAVEATFDQGLLAFQESYGIAFYDGTNFEFHNFLRSLGTGIPDFDETYYLAEPVAKAGGFSTADYGVPVHVFQLSVSDLDDSNELHLVVMNHAVGVDHKINYRVEYLYLA